MEMKCVILKGDLEDWGKHILMPFGITVCGMPTIDADKSKFKDLNHPNFKDIIFEYTEVKWDITCEKCLEMIEILKRNRQHIN